MSRKRTRSSSSSDSSSSSSTDSCTRSQERNEFKESTKTHGDLSHENDRYKPNTHDAVKRRSPSPSSSSVDSDYKRRKRKERKRRKKEKKKLKKVKKREKKIKKLAKKSKIQPLPADTSKTVSSAPIGPAPGPPIPELSDRAKAMKPMTKEEWDKRQQIIRRVYDEETGRHRLIKGDGEILEEIVSRDRHRDINRQATQGDGAFFQAHLSSKFPH